MSKTPSQSEHDRCMRLLGVSPSATAEEVKRAYRRLAHRWHPDSVAGDPARRIEAEERFKEIGAAYRYLESTLAQEERHPAAGGSPPQRPTASARVPERAQPLRRASRRNGRLNLWRLGPVCLLTAVTCGIVLYSRQGGSRDPASRVRLMRPHRIESDSDVLQIAPAAGGRQRVHSLRKGIDVTVPRDYSADQIEEAIARQRDRVRVSVTPAARARFWWRSTGVRPHD